MTVLLGALAVSEPALASGLAVVVTILLVSRTRLHTFVREHLSDAEMRDALIFGAATLVVLPLLPDQAIGPYGVFNVRAVWQLVVLVMGLEAAGHIAKRALGPSLGLPAAGLMAGFVSSLATIGAMGARARRDPCAEGGAVVAAILSNVATVVMLAVVLAATSLPTLVEMLPVLAAMLIVVGGYGSAFLVRVLRESATPDDSAGRRAFSLTQATAFALTVSVVTLIVAFVNARMGAGGVLIAVGLGGVVDTHAAAASVGSLVASGKLAASGAAAPILVALSTNTLAKAVIAFLAGGRRFALRVLPALFVLVAIGWTGAAVLGVL